MPGRDWEIAQTQLVSDAERCLSPVVTAAFAPGFLLVCLGWLTSNLAALGIALGVLGQLILSPDWFRRPLVDRVDARLSQRDRTFRQVRKRRLRQRRLERCLRRVFPIALVLISIAVPVGAALVLIRPVHLAFTWRIAIAGVVALVVLMATVAMAYGACAWIELRTLRQVRQLYVDPAVTAREFADRLESGWTPFVGWALFSVGATCAALALYVHVSLPIFAR